MSMVNISEYVLSSINILIYDLLFEKREKKLYSLPLLIQLLLSHREMSTYRLVRCRDENFYDLQFHLTKIK